jgi:hypothetical protein
VGRRLCFTNAECCRLVRKARSPGREVLGEFETPVSPDTLLRCYRELVARKWDYSDVAAITPHPDNPWMT